MKQPLFVKIKSKFKIINEYPDDDTILKTAYCSKAEYMVTEDKYLLPLQEFKGIRTVTVDEMLKIPKTNSLGLTSSTKIQGLVFWLKQL